MAHPLALAYYNPYYLIHKVTEQRLEKVAFWEALFDEAGVRVCAMDRPRSADRLARPQSGLSPSAGT